MCTASSFYSLFGFFSGLVKDLDVHKFENATKFLTSHETYILVQKVSGDHSIKKNLSHSFY